MPAFSGRWARGGVLKGESPARIAFLREILESLPGLLEFLSEGAGCLTAGIPYHRWKKDTPMAPGPAWVPMTAPMVLMGRWSVFSSQRTALSRMYFWSRVSSRPL